MSPKRPRAARRWLWAGGAGVVLAVAAAAVALFLTTREGGVYNPGVGFRTEPPPPATPALPPPPPRPRAFPVAGLRQHEDAARVPGGVDAPPPAVRAPVVRARRCAAGVHARARRAVALRSRQQGRPARDRPPPGASAVDAEGGEARGVGARLRPRADLRHAAGGRTGPWRARRRPPRDRRAHHMVAQPAQPQRVLAARRPRPGVLRLGGRDGLRAARIRRRAAVALPGRRTREGGPRALRWAPVLRRLRRPLVRGAARRRPPGVAGRDARRRPRAPRRTVLRHAGRRLRARVRR